jgi:hypothetical protein
MTATVNSSTHLVSVEIWKGIIPEVDTNPSGILIKECPIQTANSSGVENPSFVWQVDNWGYFTFLIFDRGETFEKSYNVTLDIQFFNYWDKNSLLSEG